MSLVSRQASRIDPRVLQIRVYSILVVRWIASLACLSLPLLFSVVEPISSKPLVWTGPLAAIVAACVLAAFRGACSIDDEPGVLALVCLYPIGIATTFCAVWSTMGAEQAVWLFSACTFFVAYEGLRACSVQEAVTSWSTDPDVDITLDDERFAEFVLVKHVLCGLARLVCVTPTIVLLGIWLLLAALLGHALGRVIHAIDGDLGLPESSPVPEHSVDSSFYVVLIGYMLLTCLVEVRSHCLHLLERRQQETENSFRDAKSLIAYVNWSTSAAVRHVAGFVLLFTPLFVLTIAEIDGRVLATSWCFVLVLAFTIWFWPSEQWVASRSEALRHYDKANDTRNPDGWRVVGWYSFLVSDDEAENLADEFDAHFEKHSPESMAVLRFFREHLVSTLLRPHANRLKRWWSREPEYSLTLPIPISAIDRTAARKKVLLTLFRAATTCATLSIVALPVVMFAKHLWTTYSHPVAMEVRQSGLEARFSLVGWGAEPHLLLQRATDDDLTGLRNRHLLHGLRLARTDVGNDACTAIAQIEGLEFLDLSETGVTANGVGELAGLPRLKALNLSGTEIGDEAVPALAKMESLVELSVVDTRLSADGIHDLREALPHCTVRTWSLTWTVFALVLLAVAAIALATGGWILLHLRT